MSVWARRLSAKSITVKFLGGNKLNCDCDAVTKDKTTLSPQLTGL